MNRNQKHLMNRNQKHLRRQHEQRVKMVRSEDVMQALLMRMAETGPKLVTALQSATLESHAGEYTSGHALDIMMKATARMEKAALENDAKEWLKAAADVLFLARDITISQGMIVVGMPKEVPS